jgi:adenylate cyclase
LYLFEEYVLDGERRELRRGPTLIALQPQVFDLLEHLIRNRERVVSKDDLIAAIWNGRIVSESALTTRINAARAAIGDSGEAQRLIRTLPRKGVRFIGSVHEQPQTPIAAPQVEAVVASLAEPQRPSIAVLPFVNMSGDPEQEYFADGITEDIITALSKWRWLFVIARNSTFTYKGRAVDVKQVGRELGVLYLLEGSIRRAGNRIRLTAQLVETAGGIHIWADRFDRDLTDVFALQDELTQRVAAAIEPALTRIETDRAKRKTPEQMLAWDHYLRGMWHFHRLGADDAKKAVASFERALQLDETFADAHAAIARTILSGTMYWAADQRENNRGRIFAAAKRALTLDDENINAQYVLSIASSHAGDPEAGLRFAERATQLNDNFPLGYFAYSVACLYLGRPEDGLHAIDRALRLSPSDPQIFFWHSTKASALYLCGRYAEAMESARQSLGLRRYHTALRVLAASYARLGRMDEARDAVRDLLAHQQGDMTISAVIEPFRRNLDRDRYAEALRLAGMPEGSISEQHRDGSPKPS